MPRIDDREYFLQRAKHERVIAAAARDAGVAEAHLKLAEEYERKAAELSAGDGAGKPEQ